ncbi:MAG: methyltransferase domain-containing protein [Candidatus Tectomicrobia bacterium]|nr:methyltransferase domain-containing protein [Candidatus Tectomicrobia bacterium]
MKAELFGKPYRTELCSVEIEKATFKVLRIANLNEVIETRVEKIPWIYEPLPYWMELWPSAIALASYLWKCVDLRGKRVLEVGCGLGLPGIVAERKGAEVIMGDCEEEALQFARVNARLNGCSQISFCQLDWRIVPFKTPFPCIVASDVLYEVENFQPLLILLQSLLDRQGQAIIAEPNRSIARKFFEQMEERGLKDSPYTEHVMIDGQTIEIGIHLIRP